MVEIFKVMIHISVLHALGNFVSVRVRDGGSQDVLESS